MYGRVELKNHIVYLLPFLLIPSIANFIDAGASSTPKNLVNLYTHSPNDAINISGIHQLQNEYQFRSGVSKASPPERSKSSTSFPSPETTPEHSSTEAGSFSIFDYSYQDNRATTNVPNCQGRVRLNGTRGYITDGPGFYNTNLQCSWLLDSGRSDATIRFRIHQFNTECNYDYLYIFDGDSVFSPLVAALSGDMKDFNKISIDQQDSRLENSISNRESGINSKNAAINISISDNSSSPHSPYPQELQPFEIKVNSGKAFIYFHSDTAQSMPGFYITYNIDSCHLDCSNRGHCDYASLKCHCNSGYYGDGCQHISCPSNCTSPEHGTCDKNESCICKPGYQGYDCSLKTGQQAWIQIDNQADEIAPRAFHQSVIVRDQMWVVGGRSNALSNTNMGIFKKNSTVTISIFDLKTKTWSDSRMTGMTGVDHLAELSGHSVASKGDKIFIYGGMGLNNSVLNSLTVIDTKTITTQTIPARSLTKVSEDEFIPPIAVVGHSANIVDGHMYVFLGYSPLYGYMNFVQKFNLADNSWSLVQRKGSSISGCIGHTSTYDPVARLVYIYGGHNMLRLSSLYAFDPDQESWTLLHPGPSPRYYHASVIIDRQLIVLGGNSYNTSHGSDQCYLQNYLTYELSCSRKLEDQYGKNNTGNISQCGRNCWRSVEGPRLSILKRHGHSVVVHDKNLILFGGFNGILMNDMRIFDTGNCEAYEQEKECVRAKPILNCYWELETGKCKTQSSIEKMASESSNFNHNCSKTEVKLLQQICERRDSCNDCLSTSLGCVWCGFLSQCQYAKCKIMTNKAIYDGDMCNETPKTISSEVHNGATSSRDSTFNQDLDEEMECKSRDNCHLCHSRPHCNWFSESCTYTSPGVMQTIAEQDEFSPRKLSGPALANPLNRSQLTPASSGIINFNQPPTCDTPCFMRHSCNECTTTRCIWCSTTEQCIDSSAYFAYHTTGQCMHYVALMNKCPVASCSDIETCDKCLTNPKCGWLNDISNTGKGKCIEGTSSGPSFSLDRLSHDSNFTTALSPSLLSSWYYTTCPSCQCNGHSHCKVNSSVCVQPCLDNTEGQHCERCISGYFGDPINGGSCKPCRCNGHAQSCNRETGKCFCSTKGIIGHNCNRCDDQNHYTGDPSSPNNGTCYYNLTTDYQYTFNMSRSEDHFYRDINFVNVPLRKDSDVDFTIACSRLALVNITSGTSYKNRRPIHTGLECGSFRLRFPHERHGLIESNYSFYVHVYNFQTPFILQIAFSQHRTLFLPQFFFTFSSAFLFFFFLSGLIYKLKHEYNQYIRRQRQFIEMEQMASRPFSTILLEIFKPSPSKEPDELSIPLNEPTPLSFEPCAGSNVGVMSLFVQLPGRPSLAIGSALVSLNEGLNNQCDDDASNDKRQEKGLTSV